MFVNLHCEWLKHHQIRFTTLSGQPTSNPMRPPNKKRLWKRGHIGINHVIQYTFTPNTNHVFPTIKLFGYLYTLGCGIIHVKHPFKSCIIRCAVVNKMSKTKLIDWQHIFNTIWNPTTVPITKINVQRHISNWDFSLTMPVQRQYLSISICEDHDRGLSWKISTFLVLITLCLFAYMSSAVLWNHDDIIK